MKNRPKGTDVGARPTTEGESPSQRYMLPHELALSPTVQSAVTIHAWSKFLGEVNLAELIQEERKRIESVQSGDMRPVEAMLYGQAKALETIFTNLARKANEQQYLKQFQAYLTLALKAQAQCRTTLEALAEVKSPRAVAFVRQANISGGPQQVNNGTVTENSPGARARSDAKKPASPQNELLEAKHGNDLDTRAPKAAGRADPQLETVAESHRAAHR